MILARISRAPAFAAALFVTSVVTASNANAAEPSKPAKPVATLESLWLTSPADPELLRAARAGEPAAVVAALAAGARPEATDKKGQTALMLAAAGGHFSSARELLWAGANPDRKDKLGATALDLVPPEHDERLPLQLLLRTYAFLRAQAQPAATAPRTPHRTLILENSVNYLHPQLAAIYHTNAAEQAGQPGVDDDQNGFIDDVYGWDPLANRPFTINPTQLEAYQRYRGALARIGEIHNQMSTGAITPEAGLVALGGHTNPLSDIMGPLPNLSDAEFLDMFTSAAHGSHVAGIVAQQSGGVAELHTLVTNFYDDSRYPFGPQTPTIVAALAAAHGTPEDFLVAVRARYLAQQLATGRIYSRYVAASGAGVANLSWGWEIARSQQVVSILLDHYIEHRADSDVEYTVTDEVKDELIGRFGLEFHLATAAPWAAVFQENPQVLFVIAAGNEDENADDTLPCPGYLARLLPNVVTVASTTTEGRISRFSDFGVKSVTLAAVGEEVFSTVLPDTSLYMQGTSMAAPAVAGIAARFRQLHPAVSAVELRRLLVYTVDRGNNLERFTGAGGLVSSENLLNFQSSRPEPRLVGRAVAAMNASRLDLTEYPRARADADRLSQEVVELGPDYAPAHLARAVTLHQSDRSAEAAASIDRCCELDPLHPHYWTSRAEIYQSLDNLPETIVSLDRAIRLLELAGDEHAATAARRRAWRGELHLRQGDVTAAREDAEAARSVISDLDLSDELAALLPAPAAE